jgi:uncharacterized protein involved in exopolysaccharide biosynthesis
VGNVHTDTESWLELESNIEKPGKPLHEHIRLLFDKIAFLWTQKRYLMKAAIIGFLVAVVISLLLPVKYTASADLLPPDMNPPTGLDMMIGMKAGAAALGGMSSQLNDVLGTKSIGELTIQEMQTNIVEDRLIKRFDLLSVYRTKTMETTRKALVGNTKFSEDRKSGIINVKVDDKDPRRAADIANAYGEELGKLLSDLSSDAGHREREYFAAQLVNARKLQELSTKALNDFSAQNAALELPLQNAEAVSSVAAVQRQLIAEQAELKGLSPLYTENNAKVKQARAQIAELQRQLGELRGKTGTTIASESSVSGRQGNGSGSPSEMKQLADLSTDYADLYVKAKADEAMVDNLIQQYKFSELQESRHVAQIQLLDPAQIPEKKSSPRRGRIALLGLFLGFLIGASLVVTSEWWHGTSDENEWKRILRPFANKIRNGKVGRFMLPRMSSNL